MMITRITSRVTNVNRLFTKVNKIGNLRNLIIAKTQRGFKKKGKSTKDNIRDVINR